MFYVLSREKIGSYIILLSIVVILFGLATSLRTNNIVETSVDTKENEINVLNNNTSVE